MENHTDIQPATLESVRADFREIAERQAENERMLTEKFAETDRLQKETDRQLKKSSADYDRRMINFEKTMGSWSNNHGSFAEEYFFNSFEKGEQNFFGEKFDEIKKNIPSMNKDFPDEYDLGYAILAFDDHIEQEGIKNGIVVIKQIGDTVAINDEHLKAF